MPNTSTNGNGVKFPFGCEVVRTSLRKLDYTTEIYAGYILEGSGALFITEDLIVSNGWYLTSDAWINN